MRVHMFVANLQGMTRGLLVLLFCWQQWLSWESDSFIQDYFSMKGLLPLWRWRGSFFLTDSQCQILSTFIEFLHLFDLTISLLTLFSRYRLLLGSLWILRRTCSFYTNWQHCQLKGFLLGSTTSMMFLSSFAFWWLFLVLPSSKWDTCY